MKYRDLRERLLSENRYAYYMEILEVLKNPLQTVSNECSSYLDTIGYGRLLNELRELFNSSRDEYSKKVIFGQVIIWEKYLNASRDLDEIRDLLLRMEVVYYEKNYLKSVEQVKNVLRVYARSKSIITRMENDLSVDRYLDKVSEDDFAYLVGKFDEIHKIVEEKLTQYKSLFIEKWNSGNICEIILHSLIRSNMDNQVCSLFSSNKQRVILFIIDGLGMGQYLWSQNVVPSNKNFIYSENIFNWLAKEKHSNEYILGAPLITDTAAGMCQLFTGKTSKETRVFSSTVKRSGDPRVIGVKSESPNSFAEIADTNNFSFSVDVSSELQEMKIFYCSRYDESNVSGFSKYIFDGAEVKSVVPPERVFSLLKEDCLQKNTGATVVYITSIDNSGHVMGSFSQFERYEHEKINTLFKNFLIDMAKEQPEMFDGQTRILITADHGMTESYRINISRKEILDVLHSIHEHSSKIIEANRALFLYDVTGNVEDSKKVLRRHFKERGIDVLIISKGDTLFDEFMPDSGTRYIDTTPDIAILLIGEGIFYSKDVGENLMHFGGHGGHSIDEVFVPAVEVELNTALLSSISDRFLKFE